MTKIIIPLFFLLFNSAILAKNIQFKSGEYQNTLIELYTSEGCSSCPPADKWLSQLENHPKLFSEIIPMAFHVDYWDYIGWKDKFASNKYSKQQKQHRIEGNTSQVYTPQIVKNGKEDRSWRYQSRGVSTNKKVGKLIVDVIDDTAYINFKPQQKYTALVAHVALLGSGFESQITAGENDDKILKHDFVVLGHKQKDSNINRWSIKLPTSKKLAKRFSVAVWITKPNSLKPIQVSASWF